MQISFKYILLFLVISLVSCNDDEAMEDDMMPAATEYAIQVMSPSADDKKVGEEIHIHVNFDETNMSTIHHVNVKIFKDGDDTVVMYDGPAEAHIHDDSGHYELHADVLLDSTNNVAAHTDWVVEAKVWGHDSGVAEVIDNSRMFHVHPE